ncbi:MAG: class I SAM-dependent methyltransferase [Candidatus Cloacimonetes bacterium]|nr:class I SAM-dependent methyltransferase [Candidatus Cloacimonadota bacterium]
MVNLDKAVCPVWMAYTFDNPLRGLIHSPQEMFKPYLRDGMRVLDIGCGLGFFSLSMAKHVGERGRVTAIDLQAGMLKIVEKRAGRRGLGSRITTHQCGSTELGIKTKADFILTFWMIHETPDYQSLINQIYELLEPGGIYYLADPKLHVSAKFFQEAIDYAISKGFRVKSTPRVRFSHAIVLQKQ